MPFPGRTFVFHPLVVDDERCAQSSLAARKRAFAVPGHAQQFHHAPVRGPGHVGHGLPHPGLFIGMFDQVDLVDDVHQVAGLDHAPEHAVDAEAQFPFAVAECAGKQDVGFPQIEVGPPAVRAVVAEKGGHVEDAARFVLHVEVGLRYDSARMGALSGEKGGLGKPPALRAQTARKVCHGDAGLCARGTRAVSQNDCTGAEPQEAKHAPRGHHRTRLRPVRVKSRSSMSVRNW